MGELPKDPMMLLSVVNMKLRDFYPSLDALCEDMGVERQTLEDVLQQAGYGYNADANRFI